MLYVDENALHQRLSTILNCIKYGDYDDLNIVVINNIYVTYNKDLE